MSDEQTNNEEMEQEEVKENSSGDCKNCEEYKMGWQRAQADYQNLVRETAKQKGEWMQMIKGNILEDFIPVYDNFKKAFAHEATDPKQFENWKKGIEYIMKQFGDIIKQNGVEEIKTVGEVFDARVHEIVGEEEKEAAKEHEIIREVESGYKSADKVLKVAKVIVAKSKE